MFLLVNTCCQQIRFFKKTHALFFSFLAISIYVEESYNDWSIPAASIITE